MKLTVARYALTGQSPPRLTETIVFAETAHRALAELSNGSPVFTGCDRSHKPLQGHGHAHILCQSNRGQGQDGQGEITHITVYAPVGFRFPEQWALHRLKEIYDEKESGVQLALLGLGRPEDFGGTDQEKTSALSWLNQDRGSRACPFCPRAIPRSLGRACPSATRGDCRSAARSTIYGDSSGWQDFPIQRMWSLCPALPRAGGTSPGMPSSGGGRRGRESRRRTGQDMAFASASRSRCRGRWLWGTGGHFGMGGFEADEIDNIAGIPHDRYG